MLVQTHARSGPTRRIVWQSHASVWALLATLLLGLPSNPARHLAQSDKREDVPADVKWFDSGLDVITGQTLYITAVGMVNSAQTNHDQRSPDGERGCTASADKAAPGLTCFALVARIGAGKPVLIGDGQKFNSKSNGRLALSINDDFFPDNSGSWYVDVSIDVKPAFEVRTQMASEAFGYPYPNAPDCNVTCSNGEDQWAFYQGQCTSWVSYRVNQIDHPPSRFWNHYNGVQWGNAKNWTTAAGNATPRVNVDNTPTVGAVAWYGGGNSGHVAFVEALRGDGGLVISEMNYGSKNNFDFQTVTKSYRWPDKFIHITS